MSRVAAVRVGGHDGYDRRVIEFTGAVPAYRIQLQTGTRFVTDPKGEQINLAGTNGVLVDIRPVADWTNYAGPSAFQPGFQFLREARLIQNFEGVQQVGPRHPGPCMPPRLHPGFPNPAGDRYRLDVKEMSGMRIGELTRQEVQTADLADTLSQAASQMRFADVSALPVVEAGRLVGILTERDLTRAAAEGADPRTHTVAAYMGLGPFVADPAEDSDDVVARMLDLGVRHLPILDGNELVGIVSMRDLLLLEPLRPSDRPLYAQTHRA